MFLFHLTFQVFLASASVASLLPQSSTCFGRNVTYEGILDDTVEGFIGIRFGENTGGSNRFKPPVPFVPPANTVVQATEGGPACPQQPIKKNASPSPYDLIGGSPPKDISEDCLRLNVWRPKGTQAGDNLPVLVWIYGGGFVAGYKDSSISKPHGLISQSVSNGHPIMHVEFNYRLGVFGFAQSKALEDEGSENAGLRDQRLAIQWVKSNIHVFGGDPNRITIHGQSSGGLAVGMQMLAYGAERPFPFHQAICESQALEPGITGTYTRDAMKATAGSTACGNATIDSTKTLQCLRSLSMHDLLSAQLSTATKANVADIWLPVVDGPNGFLPDAPSSLIRQRRFANVTTTIGWCEDDGTIFVPAISTAQSTRDFMRFYLPSFSKTNLDRLLSLYPISEFEDSTYPNGSVAFPAQQHRASRMLRDILFTCQPIFFGEALATAGNTVYFYDQNATIYTSLLEKFGVYGYGVVHTSELPYVFDNFDPAFNATTANVQLAKAESRSWSAFTALGKLSLLNHDTLPNWRPADFKTSTFGVYVIGGPNAGYTGSDRVHSAETALLNQRLQERCAFLNSPEIVTELNY